MCRWGFAAFFLTIYGRFQFIKNPNGCSSSQDSELPEFTIMPWLLPGQRCHFTTLVNFSQMWETNKFSLRGTRAWYHMFCFISLLFCVRSTKNDSHRRTKEFADFGFELICASGGTGGHDDLQLMVAWCLMIHANINWFIWTYILA